MKKDIRITVGQTRILIKLIQSRGITAADIKENTGIDASEVEDPEFSVSVEENYRLWQYAVEVSGDPALALHLGRSRSSDMPGFGKRIAQYSRNLNEALDHWIHYSWMTSRGTRTERRIEEDMVVISHNYLSPAYQSVRIIEYGLSVLYHYSCYITGRTLPLSCVRFIHPAPEYVPEYRRTFPSEVLFDQGENALVMPAEILDIPVVFHDPLMVSVLKEFADNRKAELNNLSSLSDRVVNYLVSNLPKGCVSVDSTAEALFMTRSTLHRKLRSEGSSYKDLMEHTRRKMAISYLKQNFSASEITYLLGYATPSTFQHSFKRWFGMNTGEMKRSLKL